MKPRYPSAFLHWWHHVERSVCAVVNREGGHNVKIRPTHQLTLSQAQHSCQSWCFTLNNGIKPQKPTDMNLKQRKKNRFVWHQTQHWLQEFKCWLDWGLDHKSIQNLRWSVSLYNLSSVVVCDAFVELHVCRVPGLDGPIMQFTGSVLNHLFLFTTVKTRNSNKERYRLRIRQTRGSWNKTRAKQDEVSKN